MVGISLKTMDFVRDDNSISLRQFASLCRERRYKEAATFVASIENVWDVWPLMRSLFREWARDAAELRHDVDAYYVTGLCRRYGMGVKMFLLRCKHSALPGDEDTLMPAGSLVNAMRRTDIGLGRLHGIAGRRIWANLMP